MRNVLLGAAVVFGCMSAAIMAFGDTPTMSRVVRCLFLGVLTSAFLLMLLGSVLDGFQLRPSVGFLWIVMVFGGVQIGRRAVRGEP